ncbi:WD40 repeat domain-containing protein [Streptomyces sp. NBC_01506]|uniref:WD40 repeat domain-containing protein n=1 Tax=Streptomyces sp. NBC_01506 TaxID=2903887 RepID=UPI0038691C80
MSAAAWGRPAAGREPAGAALLAWLADSSAPGLCVIAGGAGCGKSGLLAWLVGHGTRADTGRERTVHAFVPLAGQGVRAAVWTLADQLGLAARGAGEFVALLAGDRRPVTVVLPDLHAGADPGALAELVLALDALDHVRLVVEARTGSPVHERLAGSGAAVMDLDEPRWTDEARRTAWRAEHAGTTDPPARQVRAAVLELDDPAALCETDPWLVTAAFDADPQEHGGLRSAWLRAGQSLCRDQESADRALVLLTALGDGADPRLRPELARLAATADWKPEWSRVRGDMSPPWPGPVFAMTTEGLPAGEALLADHQGVLRTVHTVDGTPLGRTPRLPSPPAAVCALADGTVLALDNQGRPHTQTLPGAPRPTGIAALLDDGPTPAQRLTESLTAHLAHSPGTALCATPGVVAVGGADGTVHAFIPGDTDQAPRAAGLHTGRVTALAALGLPVGGGGQSIPLLYSGGADGRVRAWSPAAEPQPTPVAEHTSPVTALAAEHTPHGLLLAVARANGLIELHHLDQGQTRQFWPGAAVHALALTVGGSLLIGTDDRVICLHPQ